MGEMGNSSVDGIAGFVPDGFTAQTYISAVYTAEQQSPKQDKRTITFCKSHLATHLNIIIWLCRWIFWSLDLVQADKRQFIRVNGNKLKATSPHNIDYIYTHARFQMLIHLHLFLSLCLFLCVRFLRLLLTCKWSEYWMKTHTHTQKCLLAFTIYR